MIYTIDGVPISGFITGGSSLVVTFAIPPGTFYSGYWQINGTVLSGLGDHTDYVDLSGSIVLFPTIPDGVFSETVNVTSAQLTIINGLAGFSVPSNIGSDKNVNASLFRLVLDDTPPTPTPARRSVIGLRRRQKRVIQQIFPPIHFSADISGFSTPFGVQIDKNAYCDGIQFIPGMIYQNGVVSNSSIGMRIYKGHFKPENEFIQVPNIPDSPMYTQVCDVPIEIPFLDMLNFFIEFYNDGTAIPSNSSLEFTIIPFRQK